MLITHSTFIASPIQQVWETTTDISSWPDWAPTVQTARRLDNLGFGVGSQAIIKQPMQSRTVWTVTEITDGQFFVWETSGKAIRMRATHRLATHENGTNCTLTVKLVGPVAMICAAFLAPLIWLALMQENRGLKRWCETVSQSNPTPANHTQKAPNTTTRRIPAFAQLKRGQTDEI